MPSISLPPPQCAALHRKIDPIIQDRQFTEAHWGIQVETLGGPSLYSHNSLQNFIPASNAKLLTTAAALQALGPDHQRATTIIQESPTSFRLISPGDPGFSDTQAQDLARQLKAQGITKLPLLQLEDSPGLNPLWEWGDLQSGYGARANRLIYNQNAITIELKPQALGQPLQWSWSDPRITLPLTVINQTRTVGPTEEEFTEGRIEGDRLILTGQLQTGADPDSLAVAIPNPGQHYADRLSAAFRTAGVTIDRTTITAPNRTSNPHLATVKTPKIRELIKITNQTSNNLYAETLLQWLTPPDQTINPDPSPNTPSDLTPALTALQKHLTTIQLGLPPSSYKLTDGSGLSRQNLAAPSTLTQLLQSFARSHPFRASLPQSGSPGSLKNRFPLYPGQIQAKTGYLTGALALSGYTNPPTGQPRIFSILLNHSQLPVLTQRNQIDAIATAILTTNCQP
jgi:serine-type D-Ala-D-Ala carboxypeptidase/endopeptidase (penicillin-binding protein 4)